MAKNLYQQFLDEELPKELQEYLNKARKKRANELLDDFDYIQDNKDENNKNINNVIVDDDKNIN